MKQTTMEEAREFAIHKIKAMLVRDGRLSLEFIQGINLMLEYLDSLPERDEE